MSSPETSRTAKFSWIDTNQNMTLEEVLQFVKAKQAGKRSAGRLFKTQGINASCSQYHQHKQEDLKNRKPENKDEASIIEVNVATVKMLHPE